MPHVEVTRLVAAPIDTVYALCKDLPSFPKFMPNVERVDVLESGPGYSVTHWVAKLQGRTFRWTERDEHDDARRHMSYRQVSGDLKKFEGEWRFAEEDGKTRVTMTCDFEFGIPVLAALLNPVAALAIRNNIEGMLEAIEREATGGDGPRP